MDRFSEKAHLQVRTADNKIPGPNEPVDFDTGPFIKQGLRLAQASPCATTISMCKAQRRRRSICSVAKARTSRSTASSTSSTRCRARRATRHPPGVEGDGAEGLRFELDHRCQHAGYQTQQTDTLRNMPVVPD